MIRRLFQISEDLRPFLPLSHFARRTDVGRLYLHYNRLILRKFKRPHSRVKFYAWVVIFPLHLLVSAISSTASSGPIARRWSGRSLTSQFLQQLGFGLKYAVKPEEYYLYRFFEAEKEPVASRWVSVDLWRLIERINVGEGAAIIDRKDSFARFCVESGLPHIPVLAVLKDGRFTLGEGGGGHRVHPLRSLREDQLCSFGRRQGALLRNP